MLDLTRLFYAVRPEGSPEFSEFFRHQSTHHDFAQGSVISRQNDLPESVACLDSGIVKSVCYTSSGEEMIVGLNKPGAILGAAALLTKNRNTEACIAATACSLRFVDGRTFNRILTSEPKVSLWLARCLAAQTRAALEHQLLLREPSARARLAGFYCSLLGKEDETPAGRLNQVLSVPLKQLEIAQYLGLTPEHFCRTLRAMEREGLVERDGCSVRLSPTLVCGTTVTCSTSATLQ